MVGSLLYPSLASWTRPDITFAVSASELSRTGKPHLDSDTVLDGSRHLKRVFQYLKKTLGLGLVYRSSPSELEMPHNTLWGYVDSDWAGCPQADSRRSTSGLPSMATVASSLFGPQRLRLKPFLILSLRLA